MGVRTPEDELHTLYSAFESALQGKSKKVSTCKGVFTFRRMLSGEVAVKLKRKKRNEEYS
jgi:hypothetical protein